MKVSVKRSRAGLGLFAKEEFNKGEFIVEYTVPVLTMAEADKEGGKYLFQVNSKKTVDGSPRTNIARYINHSCEPKAESHIESGRILIKAMKTILPNEEITINYGKEYFDNQIKSIGCKCKKCLSKLV